MWSGPVVVYHLERMRAQYERGRGLYTLWVERCQAYGFSYTYGVTYWGLLTAIYRI